MNSPLPEKITSDRELDDLISKPTRPLVDFMRKLDGDIAIMGIGGKMGINLGQAAARAISEAGLKKKVYGVSRFSSAEACAQVESCGVHAIACDLLDPIAVDKLPDAQNIIFMVGRKFGTEGGAGLTWAVNTVAPSNVCRRYAKSRISAFSTGCVYPLVHASSGGCSEAVAPAPVGDYAQSALGRERIFQYYSESQRTLVCLLRLNYSVDLRYGVLHDIASAVWQGRPVGVTAPHFNIIWQGDAVRQALLALEHCASPAAVLNITGPEILSVQDLAAEFSRLMKKPVSFEGQEGPCYLNNSARATDLFGRPSISPETLVRWTADWVMAGNRSLGKPTHFEVNNGRY